MSLMILGLVLWAAVHMIPVAFIGVREQMVTKMGIGPYKGVFSLLIVLSLAFIVIGWRSIEETVVLYNIYDIAIVPSLILLIVAFIFFVSSVIKNNLGNSVRHPQLVGVGIWAFCHLLINGDLRSTVLFGGLLIWVVVTILLLNKRDIDYQKPKMVLPHKTVSAGAAGLLLFIAAVWGHEYIAGVNLMGAAGS